MNIHVRCNRPGHEIILIFTGELDLATAGQLTESLHAFGATRFARVTLDLAGIRFCDCAGLSALINARHTVTDAGGRLRIAAASKPVRRLLHVAHCDSLLSPDATAVIRMTDRTAAEPTARPCLVFDGE